MYALLDDNVVSDQKIAAVQNRGFQYGDGCFETIRVLNGEIFNAELHFQRLTKTLDVLKLEHINLTYRQFISDLDKLLAMNEYPIAARIRYTVYRSGGGLYTPDTNLAKRVVTISPLEHQNYQLNEKGLSCGICQSVRLSYHTFSPYKTISALPYVMASIELQESKHDNLIMLNNSDHVVEMCNANIFLIKGNTVFTPPISEGCIDGVYRKYIISQLTSHGYKVIQDRIHKNAINTADEVFITNSIQGIQWVGAIGRKRYHNAVIKQIQSSLIE